MNKRLISAVLVLTLLGACSPKPADNTSSGETSKIAASQTTVSASAAQNHYQNELGIYNEDNDDIYFDTLYQSVELLNILHYRANEQIDVDSKTNYKEGYKIFANSLSLYMEQQHEEAIAAVQSLLDNEKSADEMLEIIKKTYTGYQKKVDEGIQTINSVIDEGIEKEDITILYKEQNKMLSDVISVLEAKKAAKIALDELNKDDDFYP